MEFDRQAIERRDFPIGRRGYDPAAVDAHLRALAAEFEELQRAAVDRRRRHLARLDRRHPGAEHPRRRPRRPPRKSSATRSTPRARCAKRPTATPSATREEAVEKARAHVAAVAQVAAALLERVGSMDGEVNALVESLRAGAGRLAADLAAVETAWASSTTPPPDAALRRAGAPRRGFDTQLDAALASAAGGDSRPRRPQRPRAAPPSRPTSRRRRGARAAGAAGAGDLDGARLIALNMALNGESRADTERYLAENFQLADRLKLVDEVYAADRRLSRGAAERREANVCSQS